MPFGNYLELTDPAVIRALAHPARTQILAHLIESGPSTATECAEAIGGTPSGMSYHLRQLARHGFVEQVPTDDGRERRWRAMATGYGVPKDVQDRPEILAALRPLTRRWFEDYQRVITEYIATEAKFDPVWRKASTFQQSNPYVTPEELIEISERMVELLKPYQERGQRPGTERIYATFVAVPWPAKKKRQKPAATTKSGKGKARGRH
jgi:DNA-binding transcriptional ArsR family regulator